MTRKRSLVKTSSGPSIELRAIGHIPRPVNLPNTTYKIRPQMRESDDAIYVSISDYEVETQLRPFEIFVNSSYPKNYELFACVSRLVSSRLQEPGPFPDFLLGELIETFDNEGGYKVIEPWLRAIVPERHVNSIVAHIGWVLICHCRTTLNLKVRIPT